MIGDRLLWWLLLSYPVLYAVADDRRVYSDEVTVVSNNPLGIAGLLVQLVILALAAAQLFSRLVNYTNDRKILPSPLLAIALFFGTAAAVSLAKGDADAALGAVLVGVILGAISLTSDSPMSVLLRIRNFLRLQVLISVTLGLSLPSWALVPPEHNSRELFGVDTRLIGLTAGPNYMGAIAAILFTLEVFVITPRRYSRMSFAAMAVVAALWSQSRTGVGIIVLTGAIAVLVGLVGTGLNKLAGVLMWGPVVVMTFVPLMFLLISDSQFATLAKVTTGRVYAWRGAFEAIQQAPFFGITNRDFADILLRYSSQGEFLNAHNQLLETFATGGAFMALLLFGFLYSLIKSLMKQVVAHPAPLALSVAVLGQLPFGTPFRLTGISWNLVAVAVLVLCTRPWFPSQSEDPSPQVHQRGWHKRQPKGRQASMKLASASSRVRTHPRMPPATQWPVRHEG